MKETIYLETSVISAYFDFWGKSSGQKSITRQFWHKILPKYKPLISDAVIGELRRKAEWWSSYYSLIKNIDCLTVTKEKRQLAQKYIEMKVIPATKFPDALHLAIASLEQIDYFVTWNAKHITKPSKRHLIAQANRELKIYLPTFIEPKDLLE